MSKEAHLRKIMMLSSIYLYNYISKCDNRLGIRLISIWSDHIYLLANMNIVKSWGQMMVKLSLLFELGQQQEPHYLIFYNLIGYPMSLATSTQPHTIWFSTIVLDILCLLPHPPSPTLFDFLQSYWISSVSFHIHPAPHYLIFYNLIGYPLSLSTSTQPHTIWFSTILLDILCLLPHPSNPTLFDFLQSYWISSVTFHIHPTPLYLIFYNLIGYPLSLSTSTQPHTIWFSTILLDILCHFPHPPNPHYLIFYNLIGYPLSLSTSTQPHTIWFSTILLDILCHFPHPPSPTLFDFLQSYWRSSVSCHIHPTPHYLIFYNLIGYPLSLSTSTQPHTIWFSTILLDILCHFPHPPSPTLFDFLQSYWISSVTFHIHPAPHYLIFYNLIGYPLSLATSTQPHTIWFSTILLDILCHFPHPPSPTLFDFLQSYWISSVTFHIHPAPHYLIFYNLIGYPLSLSTSTQPHTIWFSTILLDILCHFPHPPSPTLFDFLQSYWISSVSFHIHPTPHYLIFYNLIGYPLSLSTSTQPHTIWFSTILLDILCHFPHPPSPTLFDFLQSYWISSVTFHIHPAPHYLIFYNLIGYPLSLSTSTQPHTIWFSTILLDILCPFPHPPSPTLFDFLQSYWISSVSFHIHPTPHYLIFYNLIEYPLSLSTSTQPHTIWFSTILLDILCHFPHPPNPTLFDFLQSYWISSVTFHIHPTPHYLIFYNLIGYPMSLATSTQPHTIWFSTIVLDILCLLPHPPSPTLFDFLQSYWISSVSFHIHPAPHYLIFYNLIGYPLSLSTSTQPHTIWFSTILLDILCLFPHPPSPTLFDFLQSYWISSVSCHIHPAPHYLIFYNLIGYPLSLSTSTQPHTIWFSTILLDILCHFPHPPSPTLFDFLQSYWISSVSCHIHPTPHYLIFYNLIGYPLSLSTSTQPHTIWFSTILLDILCHFPHPPSPTLFDFLQSYWISSVTFHIHPAPHYLIFYNLIGYPLSLSTSTQPHTIWFSTILLDILCLFPHPPNPTLFDFLQSYWISSVTFHIHPTPHYLIFYNLIGYPLSLSTSTQPHTIWFSTILLDILCHFPHPPSPTLFDFLQSYWISSVTFHIHPAPHYLIFNHLIGYPLSLSTSTQPHTIWFSTILLDILCLFPHPPNPTLFDFLQSYWISSVSFHIHPTPHYLIFYNLIGYLLSLSTSTQPHTIWFSTILLDILCHFPHPPNPTLFDFLQSYWISYVSCHIHPTPHYLIFYNRIGYPLSLATSTQPHTIWFSTILLDILCLFPHPLNPTLFDFLQSYWISSVTFHIHPAPHYLIFYNLIGYPLSLSTSTQPHTIWFSTILLDILCLFPHPPSPTLFEFLQSYWISSVTFHIHPAPHYLIFYNLIGYPLSLATSIQPHTIWFSTILLDILCHFPHPPNPTIFDFLQSYWISSVTFHIHPAPHYLIFYNLIGYPLALSTSTQPHTIWFSTILLDILCHFPHPPNPTLFDFLQSYWISSVTFHIHPAPHYLIFYNLIGYPLSLATSTQPHTIWFSTILLDILCHFPHPPSPTLFDFLQSYWISSVTFHIHPTPHYLIFYNLIGYPLSLSTSTQPHTIWFSTILLDILCHFPHPPNPTLFDFLQSYWISSVSCHIHPTPHYLIFYNLIGYPPSLSTSTQPHTIWFSTILLDILCLLPHPPNPTLFDFLQSYWISSVSFHIHPTPHYLIFYNLIGYPLSLSTSTQPHTLWFSTILLDILCHFPHPPSPTLFDFLQSYWISSVSFHIHPTPHYLIFYNLIGYPLSLSTSTQPHTLWFSTILLDILCHFPHPPSPTLFDFLQSYWISSVTFHIHPAQSWPISPFDHISQ